MDFEISDLIFNGVGIIFLGLAGWIYQRKRNFILESERAEGVVIEMVGSGSGSGTAPIVEYDVIGQKFTYRSTLYSSPPSYRVGESVEVFYKAANPEDAVLKGFMEQWFVVLLLGIIGGIFLLVGFVSSGSIE